MGLPCQRHPIDDGTKSPLRQPLLTRQLTGQTMEDLHPGRQ